MTTVPEKKVRQMPKGGRKGGTVFPRVSLADALVYAKKLVSKTHTGPQPREVILMGVIGSKHDKGTIGMSALKQYGLLKGDLKENFSADDLAKKIAAAPPEELAALYRQAILKPTVFKKLFDTFHGDVVSRAKLKQRAADLKVHPDETATCVDLYVVGMTTAGLVTVEGDQVKHLASSDVTAVSAASAAAEAEPETDEELGSEEPVEVEGSGGDGADKSANGANGDGTGQSVPRAVFHVNVTLDSSLDIEKLQKQLDLLKRFGAI
jgi:hypothetical protein